MASLPDAAWWRRNVCRVVAAAIVCGLFVSSFFGTKNPNVQSEDFGAYYRAGGYVLRGQTPYVLDPAHPLGAYMYAPVYAYFCFRWLAVLPYLWAVRVFLLGNWIATAAVVWVALQLTRPPGRRFWPAVIALIAMGEYLRANLHNGQVATWLLLACLVWLYLMLRGRRFTGGMVLSLAVMLKLYPAMLVPYLLLRRDWRGLAGVAAGTAVLVLAPAVFVGVRGVLPVHRDWIHFCLATQSPDQTVRTGNQSLLGVLARDPRVSDGNQQHINLKNLAVLNRFYPAILLCVTAILYLQSANRRLKGTPEATAEVVSVSLLLLWMTIASPRAWTFNFAAELPAALLIAGAIVDRPILRALNIAALVGVAVAIGLNTNKMKFTSHWSFPAYFVQNKHFDALVFLAVALLLNRSHRAKTVAE